MVRYLSVLICIIFLGCTSSMPNKGGYIILGEEVKAPYGYTDYMNRNKTVKEK